MPTESLTSIKLFSKATRMLVSMLVLFLRRRLSPSMPRPGDPRVLGLDRDWSEDRFSAQTARAQGTEGEVKYTHATVNCQTRPSKERETPTLQCQHTQV